MMIKVSIIVAIYKSEPFIRKCIESIIEQSYANLEIILVDDGSPDNSGIICDKFAQIDSRIIVIHKKNGGACEARNVGLEVATGDYVSIIDGDDWLENDYVEYLVSCVELYNADMAMTDHIFTTRDRKQIESDRIEKWTNEDAACAILYPRIAIAPWNKLHRLSILREKNVSFSVPWSGEGLYFSCMAAQNSNCVAVGHRKIYNYRLNNVDSGLTNYKVEMGTNALYNIKNIGDVSIIRTPKLLNAVNWHIWKNYNYVLFLIIATDSVVENRELYETCIRNIRIRLPKVLLTADMGLKSKVKMILKGLFPVYYAKKELKQAQDALKKDNME
jgi:glycosyltransferase involved in cell wall biosynthesis